MMGLPAATSPHPLIDCHLGLLWRVQDLHLPHIIGCTIPNPNHRLFESQTNNFPMLAFIAQRPQGPHMPQIMTIASLLLSPSPIAGPCIWVQFQEASRQLTMLLEDFSNRSTMHNRTWVTWSIDSSSIPHVVLATGSMCRSADPFSVLPASPTQLASVANEATIGQ